MVVTVEDTLWVTVLVLATGELPDDDGFVYMTHTISALRPWTVLPCTAFAKCARVWDAHTSGSCEDHVGIF